LIACEQLLGMYFPYGAAFIPAAFIFSPPIAFCLVLYFYVQLSNCILNHRGLRLVTIQVATIV
jgi:hypothetical protein